MAYKIGNTTVIGNDGALGSVSGNSLNLASNPNISAGGGTYTTRNNSGTLNVPSIASNGAAVITVVGGGGGGGGGANPGPGKKGVPGGVSFDILDFTPSMNTVNVTVGGAGNGGTPGPNYGWGTRGNPGGASSVNHPHMNISGYGGAGGGGVAGPQSSPGSYNGPNQGVGLPQSPNSPPSKTALNPSFNPHAFGYVPELSTSNVGIGGNGGGRYNPGSSGTAGKVRILGV